MDPESPSEPLESSPSSAPVIEEARAPSEATTSAPEISPSFQARAAEDKAKINWPGSPPEPLTLETELETDDFAMRGWHRMIDLVDYIASLVDGRGTGLFVTKAPATYVRVLGLATALKAAVQWFQLDSDPRPKFIAEAERYLAEQPIGERVVAPKPTVGNSAPISILTGPVVAKRGGRGAAGRQADMAKLKNTIVERIAPLSQEQLNSQQEAYRRATGPRGPRVAPLAWAIADTMMFDAIPNGALTEMFREQGFVWRDWDAQRAAAVHAAFQILEDADISPDEVLPEGGEVPEGFESRANRLDALAERLIKRMVQALGVTPDKDLFRSRRS